MLLSTYSTRYSLKVLFEFISNFSHRNSSISCGDRLFIISQFILFVLDQMAMNIYSYNIPTNLNTIILIRKLVHVKSVTFQYCASRVVEIRLGIIVFKQNNRSL